MSFGGFIVEYLIPPKHSHIPLAIVHCEKCDEWAPREADYMREVCTEIKCPNCGNHAIRSSEVK